MAIRTKPKPRVAHSTRSHRVKVKHLRSAPGLRPRKLLVLPGHRVAAHIPVKEEKAAPQSVELSNRGHVPSAPQGTSQIIELPGEPTVSAGNTGEVPRDMD